MINPYYIKFLKDYDGDFQSAVGEPEWSAVCAECPDDAMNVFVRQQGEAWEPEPIVIRGETIFDSIFSVKKVVTFRFCEQQISSYDYPIKRS